MNKFFRFLAVIALVALFAAPTAAEETAAAGSSDDSCPWSVYTSVGVHSDYVFRGIRLYDGTSIQPNIGITYDLGKYGRLNTNLWMHLPADSRDVDTIDQFSENVSGLSSLNNDEIFSPSKKFVELDPTISYDITFDIVTLSAGHTWYTDPDPGEVTIIRPQIDEATGAPVPFTFDTLYSRGDTAEFFAGAAIDYYLNPEVTIVKDYREYEYEYYTLGFSQPIPVNKDETFSFTPFVLFAWATSVSASDGRNFSTNYTKNGLVHVNLGLSAEMMMGNWTLKPIFTYIFTNDPNEGEDDIIWSGFDISYSM